MRFIIAAAASVAFVAFSPSARADGIPQPYHAPVVLMPTSWTGFYWGLNGGAADARWHREGFFDHVPADGANFTVDDKRNNWSPTVGVQLGYNWQYGPNWVWGVESDINWLNAKVEFADAAGFNCGGGGLSCDPAAHAAFRSEWLGTTRLRAGYAAGPTLWYLTGGVAYGDVKYFADHSVFNTGAIGSQTKTKVGWTVGGGYEAMLARNWSWKAEYLYVDLGSESFNPIPSSTENFAADISTTEHILRLGLNNKF